MSIDVIFMFSTILGHTVLCAYCYWRRPISIARSVQIFIYSSWFAWVANSLGLMFGLWSFTSPALGLFGTMLAYNNILFPVKVLSLILLFGASWRFNMAAILVLSLSCVIGEWLALKYSKLLVYNHWNLYLTFSAFFLTYSFSWYIFGTGAEMNSATDKQ